MATGDELLQIVQIVTNINTFKEELAKLDLNPRARVYYDSEVFPLLNTINDLSNGSYNFAGSAKSLATLLRLSKIKNIKHLVEDINDVSDDIFKELEDKVDELIKISENT